MHDSLAPTPPLRDVFLQPFFHLLSDFWVLFDYVGFFRGIFCEIEQFELLSFAAGANQLRLGQNAGEVPGPEQAADSDRRRGGF